jgi:hypothetical protein
MLPIDDRIVSPASADHEKSTSTLEPVVISDLQAVGFSGGTQASGDLAWFSDKRSQR